MCIIAVGRAIHKNKETEKFPNFWDFFNKHGFTFINSSMDM